MKKRIALLSCIIPLLGCSYVGQHSYAYIPSKALPDIATSVFRIGIVSLVDQRPTQNYESGLLCRLMPLVSDCYNDYERPEVSINYLNNGMKPSGDFAKALMMEINQNGLASEVFLSSGEEPISADLVIGGTIYTASIKRTFHSYGLTMLGGELLWLLGLPTDTTTTRLHVVYRMKSTTSDVIVWQHKIEGCKTRTQGLYYGRFHDHYEDMLDLLRNGLRDGVVKLATTLEGLDLDGRKKLSPPQGNQ